jgi:predicted esterase
MFSGTVFDFSHGFMNFSYQHFYQPGADSVAPPLLLLHGTGGNERDLLPLARALSPGSAVLSPLGQVSEGGARRFFARLAEGVFDPAEVAARTHALAEFIIAATAHYRIDAGRLLAVGFSNGANIAATLLQLCPASLAGGILLRPMVVLDQPAPSRSLTGKRVLLLNGDADPIVPRDHPARLAALLQAGGATVEMQSNRGGHGLAQPDIDGARGWLGSAEDS